MRIRILVGGLVLLGGAVAAQQAINPRQQPGAMVHIFAPEQHDLYDGHFVMSANRIYMVGGLNDPEGWDHLDNEAKNVKLVSGTAEIDVNEIQNTGKFEARLRLTGPNLAAAAGWTKAGSGASNILATSIRISAPPLDQFSSLAAPAGNTR